MARRRRFVRCPNCNFEHPTFGEPVGLEGSQYSIPWTCPHCHWWGELLKDHQLTKHPPKAAAGERTDYSQPSTSGG